MEGLRIWLNETRKRWPQAQLVTHGEFGLRWREELESNDDLGDRFEQVGSGIRGSGAGEEVRWFMNRDFRLGLQRTDGGAEEIMNLTRDDHPAKEAADPTPGEPTRNCSLMNRLNQKGVRPEDWPIAPSAEERRLIDVHYPELFKGSGE